MRIKSIYWNFGQNKPEKSFRYIDTSSIDRKKNIINYKNLQYLSPEQAPSRARKLVSQNSVLFSTVRPYLKNIAVVRELKEYLIASTAFIVLDTLLNETYLKYYLLSDNFINRVNNKSTGTSYPDDESVEVLLEKIRAEKQKLFEEGKIKKKDLDISIVSQGDDNSYYGNIPMNWVVIKIKDIFSMNTGLSYKKGDLSINNKGVRIIRGGNIKPLEFSLLDNDYYIDTQFISSEQVYLKHNQLITPVSTSLEHIGKFARIDKDYDGVVAGGFIFQLTPFESSEIISKFLLFNLSSPLFYKQLKAITKLSGQALYNIPKTTLSELLIPLAPFEEQELITQKVEKLFEKVNQLWK
ncbi:type I restriction enzyme [Streptococcus pneumoniae]|nr:type I restriction enzyme [Streptococcus pneumoniae]